MSAIADVPVRITVDSETAWHRIRADIDQNMLGIMETRLATLPGGKDGEAAQAVRKEVEARLAKIRDQTFALAKPNLRVNGFDYETYIPTTEPFDEALDRKVWSAEAERVMGESELGTLRKRVPEQISGREAGLEAYRTRAEWLPEGEDDEEVTKRAADIPPPPRHDEVQETFGTVASNIAELVQTAPSLLQRAQRAASVREELAHLPK